jgi:hypothetical protein
MVYRCGQQIHTASETQMRAFLLGVIMVGSLAATVSFAAAERTAGRSGSMTMQLFR